ncbi:MAG: hypothetical protein ACETWE_11740 [Candidatus Bathyarchaeia archaeon]
MEKTLRQLDSITSNQITVLPHELGSNGRPYSQKNTGGIDFDS